MTIRVLLRVSSDSQDVDSQRHAATKWLDAYGNGADAKWYVEDGVMGDAKDRPEFDRLKRECVKGDTVLCFALDRLSRAGIAPLIGIWNHFQQAGVRVASISEPWADTSNPAAEVVIAVLAWAAQQEKKRLNERRRAGIAAAKAAGKKWGGSEKGHRITVTARKERRAMELLASGIGPAEVARSTGVSRRTVYRLIDRHESQTAT